MNPSIQCSINLLVGIEGLSGAQGKALQPAYIMLEWRSTVTLPQLSNTPDLPQIEGVLTFVCLLV
jgi:hypothetical protein